MQICYHLIRIWSIPQEAETLVMTETHFCLLNSAAPTLNPFHRFCSRKASSLSFRIFILLPARVFRRERHQQAQKLDLGRRKLNDFDQILSCRKCSGRALSCHILCDSQVTDLQMYLLKCNEICKSANDREGCHLKIVIRLCAKHLVGGASTGPCRG